MSDLCLVHLVWKPLGPEPLRGFLAALDATPPGGPCGLLVVLNGFREDELAPYRALLAGRRHEALVLAEPCQDIAAYAAAARHARAGILCFCNSYSRPTVAGWMDKLHAVLAAPGVGLVGASGSWESHETNLRTLLTPRGLAQAGLERLRGGKRGGTAAAHAATPAGRRTRFAILARHRAELARAREHFDPFPTPHLRTNGFMIRRELFVQATTMPIRDKFDAHRFESGRGGLTRQVEARGLRALVVGRDGRAFAAPDWWCSGAYRSGDQENLLIADNRTAEYALAPEPGRARLREITWGRHPERTAALLAARDGGLRGAASSGTSR